MVDKKVDIKDLYSGEIISSWSDEYFVWISLPFVTLNIPLDEIEDFKEDLIELCKVL